MKKILALLIASSISLMPLAVWAVATDSSSLRPTASTPVMPYRTFFLYSQGPVAWLGSGDSLVRSFNTNPCPSGHTPYIKLTPIKVYSGALAAMSSFAVCVNRIADGPGYLYTVYALVTKDNVIFDAAGIWGQRQYHDNPLVEYQLYCYKNGEVDQPPENQYPGQNPNCLTSQFPFSNPYAM